MLKLGLLLVVLLGAAGAVAWLPVHGRTVLDRWNAASGPLDFAERAWSEARASIAPGGHGRSRSQTARAMKPAPRPGRPATPVERHTEADRAALDRIVAEHAAR